MDPNSLLVGGLVYVGIPVAIGAVEGVEAGKTAAVVTTCAGLGGYVGASIGSMISGSNSTTVNLAAVAVGIELGGVIGSVVSGILGYKAWQSYKANKLLGA
jgi:uncharacterized protein (DUF2342 family)